MGAQDSVFAIIHESLSSREKVLNISMLCEIAGVSRSGYYRWVKAENVRKMREEQDRKDFQLILDAYNYRGYKKGVRSIHMRLLHTGINMNIKKIRRLMRKYKWTVELALAPESGQMIYPGHMDVAGDF